MAKWEAKEKGLVVKRLLKKCKVFKVCFRRIVNYNLKIIKLYVFLRKLGNRK